MPTGMLVPAPSSMPSSAPPKAERLSLARGKKGGEWAELQIAGTNDQADRRSFNRWQETSRYLSLDAMAMLHEPFARASPGFDLFLPRLLDTASLQQLRVELAKFNSSLSAVATLEAAKAKWGASWIAELANDDAWIAARRTLVATVDELSRWVAEVAARGDRVWILGA